MALPRSTGQASFAPGAVANFTFANAVFTAVPAASTVVSQFVVPRTFKVQKATSVVLQTQFQSGLIMGTPFITGNEPSDPGQTMLLNIPVTNATAGTLTPTTGKFFVTQD